MNYQIGWCFLLAETALRFWIMCLLIGQVFKEFSYLGDLFSVQR